MTSQMGKLYFRSAIIYLKYNLTSQQHKSLGRKYSLIYLVKKIRLKSWGIPAVVQYEDIRFC